MTQDRIFEHYDKMIDDMHKHVIENGFHLEHWSLLDNDELLRIGFSCSKTAIKWHMNAKIWAEQVIAPIRDCYNTAEGKSKILKVLEQSFCLPPDKPDNVCKAYDCDKPSNKKKEGFCGWCFRKYQKGLLDSEGNRLRTWDEVKVDISAKLNPEKLKAFGEANPDLQKTFGCEKLNIFVDPVVCMGRIFLSERPKKECKKCRLHDSKFPILEKFLDSLSSD